MLRRSISLTDAAPTPTARAELKITACSCSRVSLLSCFESSADLYADWREWAEKAGEFVGSQKRLTQELIDRDFTVHRDYCSGNKGTRGFLGIHLRRQEK